MPIPAQTHWTNPLLAAFTACALTAVLLGLLLKRAAALPLDLPNERSLHTRPTPRIGGLALIPSAALGSFVAGLAQTDTLLLLALAGVLFLLSALDDRHGLPVTLRLGAHLVVAEAFSLLLLGPSPFALLAGLAIAWMTNLYNFMDGSNGLAGGMALIGFATFGLAASDATLGFALAGAAAGFLLFNFNPARVFLGDAGSIPLGFLAGGMGLMGIARGDWPLWFPLLVFSPFILDATITLLQRMLRGEKVWQAHRDHHYQRLIRMGQSHRQLALQAYALMIACGLSSLLLRHTTERLQLLGLLFWALIYIALMWSVQRRWRIVNRQEVAG